MPDGDTQVTFSQLQALLLPLRMRVLRQLSERRSTVTEVAAALEVPKSTAHGHLQALEQAELISKCRDGRLWVYYEPTTLGRRVVTTNPLRLVVMFSIAVCLWLGGCAIGSWERLHSTQTPVPWGIPPIGVPQEPGAQHIHPLHLLGVIMISLGLLLGFIAWWSRLDASRRRA